MRRASFWDRSWKSVSKERAEAYAAQMGLDKDRIISYLNSRGAAAVCDAGCGCGAYALRLAANGFSVAGFDVSPDAVALTRRLLSERGFSARDFRAVDIVETGYADGSFDAVIARDVIDHLPLRDGIRAVKELLRIVRPGGCVLLTLDRPDGEYLSEPHEENQDGDFLYTGGKWAGMVCHPYSPGELEKLTQGSPVVILDAAAHRPILVLEKEPDETQRGRRFHGSGTAQGSV